MERLTERSNDQNDRRLSCMGRCYNAGDCINCDLFENAVDRLAAYEDAEEQGLLVRLPCKVGTPVFIIDNYADEKHIVPDMFDYYDLSAFGKNVFLTREEAEAALAKEG